MTALVLCLTLLTLSSTDVNIHDTPLAMFHISQHEDNIIVDVSFHMDDFAKSAKVEVDDLTKEVVQEYMLKNINFRINSKRVPFMITHFSSKKNHIRVKGNLEHITEKVESLKFKNTCLIDILGHENIIYINLNGSTKDYRMNRRKKVIRVRY